MSINNTNYGMSTLHYNIGCNNTAFGAYAGYNNLDASNNTAIGSNSLFYNTTGANNTGLGAGSLCNNNTGSLNTAIGSSALEGLVSDESVGNQNVAVGAQALYSNTGDLNTSIGTYSAQNVTNGSYNTFLGAYTTFDHVNNPYQNSTAVGYNAVITGSNQIVLGGTGPAGYPQVIVPGGIIGPTGSFNTLNVSGVSHLNGPVYTPSGITGATGSFTNLNVSGKSNLNGVVNAPAGITGATGSFNNLYVSGNSVFVGGITGTNGSFGSLTLQTYPYTYTELSVVPKEYVDSIASGLKPAGSCTCATTGDIGATGNTGGVPYGIPSASLTDGVNLSNANGDSVLVVSQGATTVPPSLTTNVNNGVWIVNTSGYWTRPTSGVMATGSNASGAFSSVKSGPTYGSKVLVQQIQNSYVGTDPLAYSVLYQFNFKVGEGLVVTSTGSDSTISVDSSLNFINHLDNVAGPHAGTLNIGTNTTNTIIGPTGGGNPVIIPSGITGGTGSFSYLNASELVTANSGIVTNNAGIYTGSGPVTCGQVNASRLYYNINYTYPQTSTSPQVTYNFPGQGTYLSWNETGFGLSAFTNQRGLGYGGFNFYNVDDSSTQILLKTTAPLAIIAPSNYGSSIPTQPNGTLYIQDVSCNAVNISASSFSPDPELSIYSFSTSSNRFFINTDASAGNYNPYSQNGDIEFLFIVDTLNTTGYGFLQPNQGGLIIAPWGSTSRTNESYYPSYLRMTSSSTTIGGVTDFNSNGAKGLTITGTISQSILTVTTMNNTVCNTITLGSIISGGNLPSNVTIIYQLTSLYSGGSGGCGTYQLSPSADYTNATSTTYTIGTDLSGNNGNVNNFYGINIVGGNSGGNQLEISSNGTGYGWFGKIQSYYVDSSLTPNDVGYSPLNLNPNGGGVVVGKYSFSTDYLLDVSGNTNIAGTLYCDSSNNTVQNPAILVNCNSGNTDAMIVLRNQNTNGGITWVLDSGSSGAGIGANFAIYDATNSTSRLSISNTTGDVTISNSLSCGPLAVSYNTTYNPGSYNTLATFFDTNTNTGSQPQIEVGNSTTKSNVFGYSYSGSSTPYGFLGLSGATSTQLCYDSSGFYMGSEQTPPNSGTYKLEVGGNLLVDGSISVSSNLYSGNNYTAGTFYNTSSTSSSTNGTNTQLNIGISDNIGQCNVIGFVDNSSTKGTFGFMGLYGASSTQLTCDASSVYVGSFNQPKQLQSAYGTYKFMVDYAYTSSSPNYPVNGQVVFDIANSGGMGGSLNLSNSSAYTGSSSALSFNVDGTTAFESSGDNAANAQILAYNEDSNTNETSLRFNLWSGSEQIESMRLMPSGYVGIGTTSPAYTLDVNGTINCNSINVTNGNVQTQINNLINNYFANFTLSGGGNVAFNSSYYLSWDNRIIAIPVNTTYGTSGYFNITMPTSGTITYYEEVSGTTTKTWSSSGIQFNDWDALYYKLPIGQDYVTVNDNFFMTNYANPSFVLDSTCVLIAICNGDSDLTLKYLPEMIVMPAGSTFSSYYQTNSWYQSTITSSTSLTCSTLSVSDATTLSSTLSVSGATTLNNNLYINSLSTATTPYLLQFSNNLGDKIILWDDTSSGYYGLGIQGSTLQIYTSASDNGTEIGYGTSSSFTATLYVVNGGVKVNTTAQNNSCDLTVNGGIGTNDWFRVGSSAKGIYWPTPNVGIYPDSSTNQNLYTYPNGGTTTSFTASSFNAASDYRIKTNVRNLDSSFVVDKLRPVFYTQTAAKIDSMGFIAHEVQEEFPFLVSGEKDGEDMQSLNYQGLIALLVKEVQDLKRENKLFKEKLEQLEGFIKNE